MSRHENLQLLMHKNLNLKLHAEYPAIGLKKLAYLCREPQHVQVILDRAVPTQKAWSKSAIVRRQLRPTKKETLAWQQPLLEQHHQNLSLEPLSKRHRPQAQNYRA